MFQAVGLNGDSTSDISFQVILFLSHGLRASTYCYPWLEDIYTSTINTDLPYFGSDPNPLSFALYALHLRIPNTLYSPFQAKPSKALIYYSYLLQLLFKRLEKCGIMDSGSWMNELLYSKTE